jgi:hypothetical protein
LFRSDVRKQQRDRQADAFLFTPSVPRFDHYMVSKRACKSFEPRFICRWLFLASALVSLLENQLVS